MIKKIVFIFLWLNVLPLSAKTLPIFTENTQPTFIEPNVTIISESEAVFITRLAAMKLFVINGNRYDYDLIFTEQPRLVYWVDNTQQKFPSGFLYDLDKDDAPLIQPIGYDKSFYK